MSLRCVMLVVQVNVEVVNRTSSVEWLRWSSSLRLSTTVTVLIVSTMAAGLLLLLLLLLVVCCLRRSKLLRSSHRGRRSTDVVCPSSRVLRSSEAETLPVRDRKPPQPTSLAAGDWPTVYKCTRGTCLDRSQCTTLQPTMPVFGGKTDRLSTYVTFQVSSFLQLITLMYFSFDCYIRLSMFIANLNHEPQELHNI